ncbi:MAG: hypothetical protein HY238_00525 [Acidobacteria bacterium]|nr:hypothetical protein [Acidobacteriota bacterium]
MRGALRLLFSACASLVTAQQRGSAPRPSHWADPDTSEPAGMKYRTFRSKTINAEVSYLIYLPPAHEKHTDQRFPVLYWLHGRGGNQRGSGWVAGRLDQAIREGKAPAMILVGVNGLPYSSYVDSADGKTPVQSVIIQGLIPHIDQTYRTIPRREGRMIEGFSMGGAGAAKIGLKHRELFGVVSILAGALHDAETIAQRGDTFQQPGKEARLELFEGEDHGFTNRPGGERYRRAPEATLEFIGQSCGGEIILCLASARKSHRRRRPLIAGLRAAQQGQYCTVGGSKDRLGRPGRPKCRSNHSSTCSKTVLIRV